MRLPLSSLEQIYRGLVIILFFKTCHAVFAHAGQNKSYQVYPACQLKKENKLQAEVPDII